MAPPPASLEYWRGFFSGTRASIVDTIDAAIRVAAADHPDAFRARRDAIAERLYTALLALPPPGAPGLPTPGHPGLILPEGAGSVPSLCSSDRAEVVTDDGAAAAPRNNSSDDAVVAEAFRVKAALSNAHEKSDAELLELLQRLRQLEFTVDAIRATEIGMAVKPLRKHASKQIRQLITRPNQWMHLAWIRKNGVYLPLPWTRLPYLRTDAKECNPPNQDSVKKQSPMGQWYDPEQNWKLDQSAMKRSQPNDPFNWQTRQQSNSVAQGKPSNAAFGPGRPQMMHLEPKHSEMRSKQKQDVSVPQRIPKPTMPKPSPRRDENSVRAKLELAKEAKLEATKPKKQRTVQMVDPQDLPKQGNRNLALNGKARNSNNIRNRLGIRR
nr:unnamed protein product [Digitaria exilis]